jgi:hypothetical protein
MKLCLWIPAAESPRWPCVLSWLRSEFPDGWDISFERTLANNPKYSWNRLIRKCLDEGIDWVWSCHNDVCFVPETLPRLLSWDKKLISALVFMRSGLPMPHIWKSYSEEHKIYAMRVQNTKDFFARHPEAYQHYGPQVIAPRPEDALAEVDFTSTSCTLIHRSVLEDIRTKYGEDSWFIMDDDYNGGGEDRRFFERAREVGHKAYVDRSAIAGHLVGDVPIGVLDFMVWESVSTFLGVGEHEKFHVQRIHWQHGNQPLAGPPVEMLTAAMELLDKKEVTLGNDRADPTYSPLQNFREWAINHKDHVEREQRELEALHEPA